MWLTGRLAPDFKTIAEFRRDNGKAIRNVCRQFVVLCRQLDLLSQSLVAIHGSKFKEVNNRDRNFTHGKLRARMEQMDLKKQPAEIISGAADRLKVALTRRDLKTIKPFLKRGQQNKK